MIIAAFTVLSRCNATLPAIPKGALSQWFSAGLESGPKSDLEVASGGPFAVFHVVTTKPRTRLTLLDIKSTCAAAVNTKVLVRKITAFPIIPKIFDVCSSTAHWLRITGLNSDITSLLPYCSDKNHMENLKRLSSAAFFKEIHLSHLVLSYNVWNYHQKLPPINTENLLLCCLMFGDKYVLAFLLSVQ